MLVRLTQKDNEAGVTVPNNIITEGEGAEPDV
jgi:hypothetical protein